FTQGVNPCRARGWTGLRSARNARISGVSRVDSPEVCADPSEPGMIAGRAAESAMNGNTNRRRRNPGLDGTADPPSPFDRTTTELYGGDPSLDDQPPVTKYSAL